MPQLAVADGGEGDVRDENVTDIEIFDDTEIIFDTDVMKVAVILSGDMWNSD